MKEKYLIGLANLSNGALLGYGNKEVVEENKTRVNDYVKELEKIRDKAIEYLEKSKLNQLDTYCKYLCIDFSTGKIENIDDLLEILKGEE